MTLEQITLITAGIFSGLHAGLLYDFSVDVVPTLRQLKPKEHIRTFQVINKTIVNPWFVPSFFLPAVLLPLSAYWYRDHSVFPLLVAAALLDIVGSKLITAIGNVPLNEKLAEVNVDQLSDKEAEKIRHKFQGPGSPWMRFHMVRVLAQAASLGLILAACIKIS